MSRRPAYKPEGHEAIMALWELSDGRAIIERAFEKDPARTKIELSYLGADCIAGEIEARRDMELKRALERERRSSGHQLQLKE
jgi:hypothetical protein